jgi:hypothetical protein
MRKYIRKGPYDFALIAASLLLGAAVLYRVDVRKARLAPMGAYEDLRDAPNPVNGDVKNILHDLKENDRDPGVSAVGGAPVSEGASNEGSGSFSGEIEALRRGMRPAFTADLQGFLDQLFGDMSQDSATVANYGILRNLMNRLLSDPAYARNLAPEEKALLEKSGQSFAAKAKGWTFERDASMLGGIKPSFPSLEKPASEAPALGVHIQNSDPRAQAVERGPGVIAIVLHLDRSFQESAIRLTVGRAHIEESVRGGMSAGQVAEDVRRDLLKADSGLSVELLPPQDGADSASLRISR